MSEQHKSLSKLYEYLEKLGLQTKNANVNFRPQAYFYGKDLFNLLEEHREDIQTKIQEFTGKSVILTEQNAYSTVINLSSLNKFQGSKDGSCRL